MAAAASDRLREPMAGPRLLSSRTGRGWGSARVLSAEPLAAALVFFFRLEGQLRSKLQESARLQRSPRHTARSPAPAFSRRGLSGAEERWGADRGGRQESC